MESASADMWYLLKARTMWTLEQMFRDENFWDESLKGDTSTKSLVKIEAIESTIKKDAQEEEPSMGTDVDNYEDESLDHSIPSLNCAPQPSESDIPVERNSDSKETTATESEEKWKRCTKGFPWYRNHHRSLSTKNFGVSSNSKTKNSVVGATNHIQIHTSPTPFKKLHKDRGFKKVINSSYNLVDASSKTAHLCSYCSYSASDKKSLTNHLAIHTCEKPYACSKCSSKFRQSVELTKHFHSMHEGVQPYTCDTCGKWLSCKEHLDKHTMSHSWGKPYSCEKCGKTFALSSSRNKHMSLCAKTKHCI